MTKKLEILLAAVLRACVAERYAGFPSGGFQCRICGAETDSDAPPRHLDTCELAAFERELAAQGPPHTARSVRWICPVHGELGYQWGETCDECAQRPPKP